MFINLLLSFFSLFRRFFFLLIVIFVTISSTYAKEKVVVFAASSLSYILDDIAKNYQQHNLDVEFTFSFASSSTLAKQITQGAPAALFISAHPLWAEYLAKQKIVSENAIKPLLTNSLVFITYPDSVLTKMPFDLQQATQLNWSSLLTNEKIVIGDPEHVPAGIYAKEALTQLKLYDTFAPHFVFANSVKNALRFVEQKEALAGIVYYSDAINNDKITVLSQFPAQTHEPILYHLVEINENSSLATKRFAEYLYSDYAKQTFKKYGLAVIQ